MESISGESLVRKMAENKDTEKILTIVKSTDTTIAANIEESYIFTTEDKVRILYDEYNAIRKVSSDMLSWLGIFITLLISDLTCEFKQFWFFEPSVIRAVFLVSTILFLILFVRGLICWIGNKNKLKFNFFIDQLKGGENLNQR